MDILTSFIPRDRVQFNKRLTDIEQREDHVVLSFADGTVAQAALVVGADGIQSIVREHVLRSIDPEGIAPRYANSYAYRAVIPMADAKEILGDRLTDTAKMYLGKDRLVVTYRVSGGAVSDFVILDRIGEVSYRLIESHIGVQLLALCLRAEQPVAFTGSSDPEGDQRGDARRFR